MVDVFNQKVGKENFILIVDRRENNHLRNEMKKHNKKVKKANKSRKTNTVLELIKFVLAIVIMFVGIITGYFALITLCKVILMFQSSNVTITLVEGINAVIWFLILNFLIYKTK